MEDEERSFKPQEDEPKSSFKEKFGDMFDKIKYKKDALVNSDSWKEFEKICKDLGVVANEFKGWTIKQGKMVIEAAEAKWPNSKILKLLNPKHTLEQTMSIFRCLKDNVSLTVLNGVKNYDEAQKAVNNALERLGREEKARGVSFQENLSYLSPERAFEYSQLSEDKKLEITKILGVDPRVKLSDIDERNPDFIKLTKGQLSLIGTFGHLYHFKSPFDIMSGNIFKVADHEGNIKMQSQEQMLNTIAHDLMGMYGNNPIRVFNKHYQDIINLERLSIEITGKPNEYLTMLAHNPSEFGLDARQAHDLCEAEVGLLKEHLTNNKIKVDQKIFDEYNKNGELKTKSYKELEQISKKLSKECDRPQDEIMHKLQKYALVSSNTFLENGKVFDANNYDKLNIRSQIEKHIDDIAHGTGENYQINNGNYKIDFSENGLSITSHGKTIELSQDELKNLSNEKNASEKFEKVNDLVHFAQSGETREDITKKNAETVKKETAKETVEQRSSREAEDKKSSVIQKLNNQELNNDVEKFKQDIMEKTGLQNLNVVITPGGKLEVRSQNLGPASALVYDPRKDSPEVQNRENFLEQSGKTNTEEILGSINQSFADFSQKWNPDVIKTESKKIDVERDNATIRSLGVKQNYYINSNNSIELGINDDLKKIADICPTAKAVIISENGKVGIVFEDRTDDKFGTQFGMIEFGKNGFDVIGNGQDIDKLKRQDRIDTPNGKENITNVLNNIASQTVQKAADVQSRDDQSIGDDD